MELFSAMRSRSMSGCRKRLKSTSAFTPSSSNFSATLAKEVKYGESLRAMGMFTALRTERTASMHRFSMSAAGDGGVGPHRVDVHLDAVGAGVLEPLRVLAPAPRGGAFRLAMTGMRTDFLALSRRRRYSRGPMRWGGM